MKFNIKNFELKKCIICICEGIVPENESKFIQLCLRFSYGTLMYLKTAGYHVEDEKLKSCNELENLAVDTIAELFERNTKGQYVQIRKYFQNHPVHDLSENQCIHLLRSLVTNRTRQALYRIFRERDPEGAKINDALKAFIASSKEYSITQRFNGHFIRSNDSSPSGCQLPRLIENISPSDLQLLFSLFRPWFSYKRLIEKALSFFKERYSPSFAIELNEVNAVIKRYRSEVGARELNRQFSSPTMNTGDDGLASDEMNRQIAGVIGKIHEKVTIDYLNKNKLDEEVAHGLIKAIDLMADDIIRGNGVHNNYNYVKKYLPHLDKESYQREIRPIFEYLIKLMKNDIQYIARKNSA